MTTASPDRNLLTASINTASSGETTIISAVAGQKIYVHRLLLTTASAVNIYFVDGAGGTAYSGAMSELLTLGLDYNQEPYYVTTTGNAFVIGLSAAVQVSGTVWYYQK